MFMYQPIKLDYENDSLEPFIDTHTIGLHYYKHYLSYLKKLNDSLKKYPSLYQYPLSLLSYHLDMVSDEERDSILFYLGGVLNHELYFKSIHPIPREPSIELLNKINDTYGNIKNMLDIFLEESINIRGSGYVFLVINENKKLEIISMKDQDSPYFYGMLPLFCIDMWEHAYYLNYKNYRELYIKNFIEILDFKLADEIVSSLDY